MSCPKPSDDWIVIIPTTTKKNDNSVSHGNNGLIEWWRGKTKLNGVQ